MVSNTGSVNYNELGEVTTAIDAWLENETGSTATLCVRSRVYSTSDGVSGWGIAAQSGYSGNGNDESVVVGSGVINYDDVVIDETSTWAINKTHDGWTASCFVKSYGEEVDGVGAYPLENEVTCSLDIPATTSYVVSYNANGGTGAPENQIKWHDEALVLSSVVPTRTGHTFQGWGISEDDTTVDYAPGISYTGNTDLTLYAIWKPNTWTVRYDSNGGVGAPENQTKVYGQTLVLSSVKPTRTGYTFQGWATTATGSVSYQPGGEYTSNANVTLYAIWKINTYTLSYNANGGYDSPESQTKEYGETIVISDVEPLRSGYMFLGWATSSSGKATYHAGDNYSENANRTLYAVWEDIPIMKMLNGYEIYDEASREQITGVVTTGTGSAYKATVKGVYALTAGVNFMMIPHVVSTSVAPTLDVNGFGARTIKQRITTSTTSTVALNLASMLAANKPVKMIYDGEYWIVDFNRPDASTLYGTVAIEDGGTGATTAKDALKNLGITWGTSEAPATGTPNTIYIQIN